MDADVVTKQYTPDYCMTSYWGYSMILNTDNPEKDWYRFRGSFSKKWWRWILCSLEINLSRRFIC